MGYIYIFTNSDHPDMVKIGYSDSWKQRLKNANNETNNLATISCHAAYEVDKRLADKIFFDIIEILNPSCRFVKERADSDNDRERVTEWFNLSKDNAYRIFEVIAEISSTQDRLVLVGKKDEKKKTSSGRRSGEKSHTEAKKPTIDSYLTSKTVDVNEFDFKDATLYFPTSVIFNGEEHVLEKTKWRDALIYIIDKLYSLDPSKILPLVDTIFSFSGKEQKSLKIPYVTKNSETIRNWNNRKLANHIIPNTNICFYLQFDSKNTFRFLRFLVDRYGQDSCSCLLKISPNVQSKL